MKSVGVKRLSRLTELAQTLSEQVEGEVRFDRGSRALYATDSSNYRQTPIGVVVPKTVEDVEATIATCREFEAPVLPRGAGTSLSGQTCNVAVVVDMSKYLNKVLEVNPDLALARVQPGVILDDLRDAAEEFNLTFAPDPATHNRCTLGGMIGNNSCGVHSIMAGKTDANVHSLDVLTYRGARFRAGNEDESRLEDLLRHGGEQATIYQRLRTLRDSNADYIRGGFVDIPRRVSGFDLPYLLPEEGFNLAGALVGTEGTCVTVLEACVKLVHSPQARSLVVLGYEDVFAAADAVTDVMAFGPIGLEGIDDQLVRDCTSRGLALDAIELLPQGRGWLLAEFGAATKSESDDLARRAAEGSRTSSYLCRSSAEAKKLWEARESALGATAIVPGKFERWAGWDDSAVAPERLGSYLRDLQKLMDARDLNGAFYGHFGDGCLHVRYNFDFETHDGIQQYKRFLYEAADLVVAYGGSLSGEHGDGQAHGELLEKMYSPALMSAFREFKSIFDPDWKMNPGKVVNPLPLDQDIRIGSEFHSHNRKTMFSFRADGGTLSRSILRCVGVGKCRQHDTGTMCPSYMVTREEKHSTRGRARMLFEMLKGETVQGGWRDRDVKESLDLCLACKACKTECPTNVDMATYKAEFLSQYYKRRIRPRSAYSMGLIYWWSRAATTAPRLANLAGHAPLVSRLLKWGAGVSPRRSLPRFAESTFREQFARARESCLTANTKRVILWADTFNNHFHPETAVAAASVLRTAGFDVHIPGKQLCCGRPLYDFGMLDLARHHLRTILKELKPEIEAGTPIVVLEPSCASVFREELPNLFPDNTAAARLRDSVYLFADFVVANDEQFKWPALTGQAVVHGHCHQKSVLGGLSGESTLLGRLGLNAQILDSGCCGMAGAFGFETGHYDVSVACAERALLPSLAESGEEDILVVNGFSCREQIQQLWGRKTLHIAEVLARALEPPALP